MPESPGKRRGHENLVSGRAVVVSSVAERTADGCMGRQWDCYATQVGGWSSFCVCWSLPKHRHLPWSEREVVVCGTPPPRAGLIPRDDGQDLRSGRFRLLPPKLRETNGLIRNHLPLTLENPEITS